jgi:glycosyltransferase involved in cell wall biosynthesis
MTESTLFITYDGLLDPLGGSQILPYLYSIAQHPRPLHILSFEKRDRFIAGAEKLQKELQQRGISWIPLSFTTRFGKLGKLWDLVRMYFWCARISILNNVKIIHARGHPTAQIGLFAKRIFGTKLIFDFRGLWVDERVDKGGWDLARKFHRMQYNHFKRTERKLLANADQLVVLTNAVVPEVIKLGALPESKITVIPCCADFDHFPLTNLQRRASARKRAGIPGDALVLGYLGSVGRMYMLDRFFRLFELAAASHAKVCALVITHDLDVLKELMIRNLPLELHDRIHVCSVSRDDVPKIIPAMDILVSFIQSSYARMAASPTKLAECFAQGIPAICNAGVGDIAEQMQLLDSGIIVNPASDHDLKAVVSRLDEICQMGGVRLRKKAQEILSLDIAVAKYKSVYLKIK